MKQTSRGNRLENGTKMPKNRGLDPIGWFIAMLHNFLGHEKTAVYLNQPVGNREICLLCRYEREPSDENRQAVYNVLRHLNGS